MVLKCIHIQKQHIIRDPAHNHKKSTRDNDTINDNIKNNINIYNSEWCLGDAQIRNTYEKSEENDKNA